MQCPRVQPSCPSAILLEDYLGKNGLSHKPKLAWRQAVERSPGALGAGGQGPRSWEEGAIWFKRR